MLLLPRYTCVTELSVVKLTTLPMTLLLNEARAQQPCLHLKTLSLLAANSLGIFSRYSAVFIIERTLPA
ncbi:hypothetical protein EDC56_0129 [Sinobacterium caligoides]|uniref:Uncharacterized protein n=1 Tax=Sinobacterium caligoides TaxID=933926 RepID=A0A3N2DXQ9_9GAMM|nr:hypothetical protein EDC56_0129 [Sinobacterium caligoides]